MAVLDEPEMTGDGSRGYFSQKSPLLELVEKPFQDKVVAPLRGPSLATPHPLGEPISYFRYYS